MMKKLPFWLILTFFWCAGINQAGLAQTSYYFFGYGDWDDPFN